MSLPECMDGYAICEKCKGSGHEWRGDYANLSGCNPAKTNPCGPRDDSRRATPYVCPDCNGAGIVPADSPRNTDAEPLARFHCGMPPLEAHMTPAFEGPVVGFNDTPAKDTPMDRFPIGARVRDKGDNTIGTVCTWEELHGACRALKQKCDLVPIRFDVKIFGGDYYHTCHKLDLELIADESAQTPQEKGTDMTNERMNSVIGAAVAFLPRVAYRTAIAAVKGGSGPVAKVTYFVFAPVRYILRKTVGGACFAFGGITVYYNADAIYDGITVAAAAVGSAWTYIVG